MKGVAERDKSWNLGNLAQGMRPLKAGLVGAEADKSLLVICRFWAQFPIT
jgi:hypothetical protein